MQLRKEGLKKFSLTFPTSLNWEGKLDFLKPSILFSLFPRRLRKNCEDPIYNDFFIPRFKYTNFISLLKLMLCDHIRNYCVTLSLPRVQNTKLNQVHSLLNKQVRTLSVALKKILHLNCHLVLRLGKHCRGINSSTINVKKILPYTYGVADNNAVDFSRPSLQGWTWFTVSLSCHRSSFGCLVVLCIQWTDRYQTEQIACQEVGVHVKFLL